MVVMKFGGTSVADRASIERLMAIVRRQRDKDAATPSGVRGPVVVVSALSGVTDRLLGVAAEAGAGDAEGARHNLRDLRARHMTVAEVVTDQALRAQVQADIDVEFDELERIVSALGVLREVSPRWLDTIAATGEVVSSRIVAAALAAHGLHGAWVDARKAVVTRSEHTAAAPLFPETTVALEAQMLGPLAAGQIPVMGGFVGATVDGVTTTLGRGGSDYSASLFGAAMEAEAIEIWTDVDGMLTADPRVVPDAQLIGHIRFDEAAELANFGAKVLHPSTIAPAVKKGIPVFVFNSRKPEGTGTRITFDAPRTPVRAIAGKTRTVVVKIRSPRMLATPGALRAIFEVFERNRTSVDVVATSEVSVSVTVDDDQHLEAVVAQLASFGDVSVERNRGIVALVGAGLGESTETMARALHALGDLRLYMVSLSATGINLTLIVDGDQVNEAMRRLHAAFFGGAAA